MYTWNTHNIVSQLYFHNDTKCLNAVELMSQLQVWSQKACVLLFSPSQLCRLPCEPLSAGWEITEDESTWTIDEPFQMRPPWPVSPSWATSGPEIQEQVQPRPAEPSPGHHNCLVVTQTPELNMLVPSPTSFGGGLLHRNNYENKNGYLEVRCCPHKNLIWLGDWVI